MAVTDDRAPAGQSRFEGEFDRQPPQDITAEQSVLGGMLLSKDAIADVVEVLRPTDFYRPAHQTIYEGILDLYGRGEPADPVTVSGALTRSGDLIRIGGAPYLHTLIASVPTAANAGYYAQIVAERAILRRLVDAGTKIVQMGYGAARGDGAEGEIDDIVDRAQSAVYEVTERRMAEDYTILEEILQPTMDEIDAIASRGGAVGVPTGFTELDEITNGLHPGQMVIIAARPAIGKCLAADTVVTETLSGRRMTIEEFVRRGRTGEPLLINTLCDDLAIGEIRPTDFIHNGRQPVLRVTTRSGRTLRATATHPLLTVGGWVPLQELAAGRHIAAPRRLPMCPVEDLRTDLPDSLVALTAYLLTDGVLDADEPRVSSANSELVTDLLQWAGELGLKAETVPGRRGTVVSLDPAYSEGPHPLADHLRAHGLDGLRQAERFVPADYFGLPVRQVRLFVSRLYAAGGWASLERVGGAVTPQIGFSTTSERLARDVQHLLLRLGFAADLRSRVEQGPDRRTWMLTLLRSADIERFVREVGLFGRPARSAEMLLAVDGKVPNPNTDVVPAEVWELIHRERGDLPWAEISARCGLPRNYNWHPGQAIGRRRLELLAKALDSERLLDLSRSDLIWDEIVSIEPAGVAEVYDLTIPDLHNFVAGDLVVHNSALGLDMARACSVKAGLASVIFSLEMSKTEITMRLLSAEAKVPLHHMRSGHMSEEDWTRLARRMGEIADAPLYIDDSPNLTMMEIRAKARRLKQRNDLKLIVIDYLQLMTSGKRVESRQQEVSDFSRSLKLLAKELEVPVIALCQLNRGPEQRTDKKPMLSDLRESGCLPATTRIMRADTGAEVSLGELMSSGATDVPVWSLDSSLRLVPRTMTHAFSSGRKEVFRLRLASGRQVDATANHPFLTYDGWRRLDELEHKTRLAVPRHVPAPLDVREWADDEAIMLGQLIGDGSCIPAEVFSLPKRQLALFLGHLWATDGSVRWDDEAGGCRLHCTTASRRQADDLARLLLRFNIMVRIQEIGTVGQEPGWQVSVVGAENQLRFLDEIEVHGAQSFAAAYCAERLRASANDSTVDTVPAEVWSGVREVLADRYAPSAPDARQPLGQVTAVLDNAELEVLATNDVFWDEVVSIESIGEQDVYDATVLGTHNFIADGVAVHNSLEQDADMVVLIHREDAYERESPRAGEADLLLVKHRNGPTGVVTVAFQGHYSRFVDMAR